MGNSLWCPHIDWYGVTHFSTVGIWLRFMVTSRTTHTHYLLGILAWIRCVPMMAMFPMLRFAIVFDLCFVYLVYISVSPVWSLISLQADRVSSPPWSVCRQAMSWLVLLRQNLLKSLNAYIVVSLRVSCTSQEKPVPISLNKTKSWFMVHLPTWLPRICPWRSHQIPSGSLSILIWMNSWVGVDSMHVVVQIVVPPGVRVPCRSCQHVFGTCPQASLMWLCLQPPSSSLHRISCSWCNRSQGLQTSPSYSSSSWRDDECPQTSILALTWVRRTHCHSLVSITVWLVVVQAWVLLWSYCQVRAIGLALGIVQALNLVGFGHLATRTVFLGILPTLSFSLA